jgi:hypothetical protein
MRARILGLTAAALLACPMAMTATAATITGTFYFTASGFSAGAPVDPVSGWVSYSFDGSAGFLNAKNGDVVNGAPVQVSVSGLNLPGSWVPVLTFNPPFAPGIVAIGHSLNGTVTTAGTDDWRVAFNNAATNPTFREFTYTTAGTNVLFVSTTGTVTAPEPATVALLGVSALGLAWRRRRRS